MLCTKLLVGYDGSHLANLALEKAIEIAKIDERIQIHVLYIENESITYDYTANNEGIVKTLHVKDHRLLKGVESQLHKLPNFSLVSIEKGHPAEAILSYAKKELCDLIIMGSRGLSGLKEIFLGSISHHVVQRAEVPVLIVKH